MQAEFDQHHAEQLGEGGRATALAATVFDGFGIDGWRVSEIEAGAVEGRGGVDASGIRLIKASVLKVPAKYAESRR